MTRNNAARRYGRRALRAVRHPYSPRRGRVVGAGHRCVILALLVALFLASCGPSAPTDADMAPGAGRPKRILATFTVIADMAQNVAGDEAIVDSITKPGVEIHDYQPTPSDIVRAQQADLILNNGLGLERWFTKFMGAVKDVPTVDLSEGIVAIPIAQGPFHDEPNPHAWMSLANAKVYVENIRRALVKLDPAKAAVYNANAAAYIAKFQPVQDQLDAALDRIPEDQRALVTCEGAFSYFARDAGMKERYLWAVNSDQEGTPEQVKQVVDDVRAHHYPVVFCESTVNPKAMRQVAKETGAQFGGTLYVDSLTTAGGDAPTYLAMLKFNVQLIVDGYAPASNEG